ncbi:hypothetical protein Ssi03_62560 [Sphaerisporangium siamense]|uniref:Uncharacterized protein n=1 Tax=Sphaerisporangium siamense TaxID=795645 RepID=A0A7W7GBL8_9ACTN|nr:hypothetical protein [Sphaerisporangium siamense]MBB4702564.1 hypothetical protein [Sphaerisporangium siamense]GII88266.1 hypothetical protein Ssi03_62560 [Sphaerisporangium siamense]
MIVSFRLPRISLGTASNLVGLLGLAAIAVAVGGLTGSAWWAVLVGGVEALGVAYLAGISAQAAEPIRGQAEPDLPRRATAKAA